MFSNLGLPELLLLAVIGLLVFGPERLPKAAADAGRLIRQLRQMARGAMHEVRTELGPEFADLDVSSLHPRRLVNDHIFGDD
ncbi:MAG TPA: sec-independent translocase [Mycobacteriales bacterium]|nr:sec-independent translocase [Mycobacteriales bacterium]